MLSTKGMTIKEWWRRLIHREPHDIIRTPEGQPQVLRWWLVPRNTLFNIYLHKIIKSDDLRALHDHPWHNVSFVLKGKYLEKTTKGYHMRNRFSLTFRHMDQRHRIELIDKNPAWSLFLTGPERTDREWGFWLEKGSFIPNSIYKLLSPGWKSK